MFGAESAVEKAGDTRRDRKKTLREGKTQVGDMRGADTGAGFSTSYDLLVTNAAFPLIVFSAMLHLQSTAFSLGSVSMGKIVPHWMPCKTTVM